MGYSRDTFYRYQQAVEEGGVEALIEKSRRKPNIRNRVAPEIEEAIVTLAIDQPALGQVRVSNELRRRGDQISPAGVRGVWQRHDLETFKKRLLALEKKVAGYSQPSTNGGGTSTSSGSEARSSSSAMRAGTPAGRPSRSPGSGQSAVKKSDL